MFVGERVKKFRVAAGLSGRALAALINVDPSQISKIEKNVTNPSFDALERMCKVFKITISDFFADEEPTQSPEIIRLVKAAEKLSPEQIELITSLINNMKDKP